MESNAKAHISEENSPFEQALIAGIIGLAVIIVLMVCLFVVKYMSERNAPPRNYYDYQLRVWREVLRKNPKDPAALTNIGYIYMKMGDKSKGRFFFDQALASDKNFVPALYNLGLFYKNQGQSNEAVAWLGKAGEKAAGGNKYLAYYSLGELYFESRDYGKAKEFFERSLNDNATIWNTYEKLGRIYEVKKDKLKALESYKKALSFNPNSVSLKRKIGELTNGTSGND